MTAIDVQATLEYLIPGFLALKVFYLGGRRTRRSDFEWTVLSIAAAAVLNGLVGVVGSPWSSYRVLVSTVVGVVIALLASLAWRWVTGRFPGVRAAFDRQAWDALWGQRAWVQVWMRGGPIILGVPRVASESAETDEHDVYLVSPSWVDRESGARTPVVGVIGIWVAARDIELVQVLDPNPPAVAIADEGGPASPSSPEEGRRKSKLRSWKF